jgi:hypothetical protein
MRYAVELEKKSWNIMYYVQLVQAVMPEELVHQSRTAGPREEEPDAKGRYPWDRLSSLLSGLRCLMQNWSETELRYQVWRLS